MQFNELQLSLPLQQALRDEGYTEATPIQAQAIPPALAYHDILGIAQTGTGKTAAFAIPILSHLKRSTTPKRPIQALILAPTRELAIQIDDSFKAYGRHLPFKSTVIFGGVSQHPQTQALGKGVDVLVATPGRLLDLIGQKFIRLDQLSVFVLDEADQMLDMGMIHDVKRIVNLLPKERQTMFFSATMPDEIAQLANTILKDPVRVEVTPSATTVDTINQQLYFVAKPEKPNLLVHLLRTLKADRVLIFSRTKHGADKIVRFLSKANIASAAIHGNKSQNARQAALKAFKDHQVRILVATDIAARGLDIDELSHVLIYDLPEVPETYVHRIGRTGRAGLGGTAISFCDAEEVGLLRDILKLIKRHIPIVSDHPFALTVDPTTYMPKVQAAPKLLPKQPHPKPKDPSRFHRHKPHPKPTKKPA
jgi:ATP-dependent RNA helicase RhlE